MKPGDIVEIFTDPMNQRHSEGEAELVELLNIFYDAEYWLVKFPDDWVRPRLIIKNQQQ